MRGSITYCTPALMGRRWVSGPQGLLTLHLGRLTYTMHSGGTLFDRDLADFAVGELHHRETAFDLTTVEGEKWRCGFWDRSQKPSWAPTTNPFDVPIEDVDLTKKSGAQDTCWSWVRILADPSAPDPAAWHPGVER